MPFLAFCIASETPSHTSNLTSVPTRDVGVWLQRTVVCVSMLRITLKGPTMGNSIWAWNEAYSDFRK